MYLALRGIVPRCCRGSVESLMQRSSGLPCLARKQMFSSRFLGAFIGSFAPLLLSSIARAICSVAHFRSDNREKLSIFWSHRRPVIPHSAFRIPHSELTMLTPFARYIRCAHSIYAPSSHSIYCLTAIRYVCAALRRYG